VRPIALLAATVVLGGCGAAKTESSPVPAGVGIGPRYRPPAHGAAVRAAEPVGGLRCSRARVGRFGVHVELLVDRRVILVPAGVGVAPPVRRRGAYVAAGLCSYPIRTLAPTGVLEVERERRLTLGDVFALWGQRLTRRSLGGFLAARDRGVEAFVDGRRWTGDPRAVPLRRHAEIYLAVGRAPPPHAAYRFPPGL